MIRELINPSIPHSDIRLPGNPPHPAKRTQRIDLHMHNEMELLLVLDGISDYFVGEKQYRLQTGDIIFINRRVPHRIVKHQGTTAFYILFGAEQTDDIAGKYLSRFANTETEATLLPAGSALHRAMDQSLRLILEEYQRKAPSYESYIKAEVGRMQAHLYRFGILRQPENHFSLPAIQKILPALEYIDTHYKEEITLSDLSRLLNLNESYFCRLFKQATNTSFVQYLNFVRVCKAEQLLCTTDMNISEICFAVGFSTASYFNRIFKKYKNCSPGLYKKIKYSRIER